MLIRKENSPLVSRASGAARVVATCHKDKTVLPTRYSAQPYRLMVPEVERGEVPQVVLSNLSGGILNGDQFDLDVTLAANSQLLFTGQAAEKVYRAADHRAAVLKNRIMLENGAALEYLPQGMIQFDGARLDRETIIDLHPTARLLAGEILYLGRQAMGETLTSGLLRDVWQIRIGGRLAWEDRMLLEDRQMTALQHPAALDGASVTAMLFYAGPDAADWQEPLRETLIVDREKQAFRFGLTLVNGILLMRWLGKDGQAIRHSLGNIAARLRHDILGRPAVLPRIWHI